MTTITLPPGIYPSLGYDGKITFAGVLQDCFFKEGDAGNNIGISRKWNSNTASQYSRDYIDRLLPTMARLFGAEQPMHAFTEEHFDTILMDLKHRYHYAESTVMHYRYLLWIVYQAGFESGLYADNIFWNELFDPHTSPNDYEKHRAAAMTRIRKSFSIAEDIRIMRWFLALDPITASGSDLALACMYFLGCRNNEACGANFGAFYLLHSYPNMPVFDMLQSTEIGSNHVKGGGKSSNAPRTLPVPRVFYQFLQKRRNWLIREIELGHIHLPNGISSVDQLPIACSGTDYGARIHSSDLSKAGHALFQKIGIHKSELAVLNEILFSEEFKQCDIIEKNPTTYLFRRNVATRLYHLGFEWTTIQYWIAHEIEDTILVRNFFSDEDTLYGIGQRYELHPIFHLDDDTSVISSETHHLDHNTSIFVRISTLEPNQPIDVSILAAGSLVQVSLTEMPLFDPCKDQVEIIHMLYYAYRCKSKEISSSDPYSCILHPKDLS